VRFCFKAWFQTSAAKTKRLTMTEHPFHKEINDRIKALHDSYMQAPRSSNDELICELINVCDMLNQRCRDLERGAQEADRNLREAFRQRDRYLP
jgi:hypothetical protein